MSGSRCRSPSFSEKPYVHSNEILQPAWEQWLSLPDPAPVTPAVSCFFARGTNTFDRVQNSCKSKTEGKLAAGFGASWKRAQSHDLLSFGRPFSSNPAILTSLRVFSQ